MNQIPDIRRVEKPWGHEEIFAHTRDYVGKILVIKAGHELSLQFHNVKEESIYVTEGELAFELENESGEIVTHTLKPGQAAHVAPKMKHRMRAVTDCRIFEVSTPHLDDVVRLEDRYGRVDSSEKTT